MKGHETGEEYSTTEKGSAIAVLFSDLPRYSNDARQSTVLEVRAVLYHRRARLAQ